MLLLYKIKKLQGSEKYALILLKVSYKRNAVHSAFYDKKQLQLKIRKKCLDRYWKHLFLN